MKLYIPEIGDNITLDSDWTFEVHKERRNSSLIQRIFNNNTNIEFYIDYWPMHLHVEMYYDIKNENHTFQGDGKHFQDMVDIINNNKPNSMDPDLYSCLYTINHKPINPIWTMNKQEYKFKNVIITQNDIQRQIISNATVSYSNINYNKKYNNIDKLQIKNVKIIDNLKLTLPKGTILKIDRIYIRKGLGEFSSISFIIESCPVNELTDTKSLPKDFLGYKAEKSKVRFWAKLSDCNKMEIT